VNRSIWPNLFTATRLALAPAVVMAAVAGSRPWFVVLVTAALLTDAIDGYLARRLNAYSELGRKLDSVADYVTMLTGTAGIALLWPEHMRRELPWVVAGLGAFFAAQVQALVRLGRVPCYHTWTAKVGTLGCALALAPLLADWAAWPFHVMIGVQIAAGVETTAISWLVPAHTGPMATVWHAWRARQAARGGAALTGRAGAGTSDGR
jgi:phosphatidylglycerophosphate synthase